jgi:hypothetical protein
MRVTYRIDIRVAVLAERVRGDSDWRPQTRVKTKREAESIADTWRARGYETRVVVER